MPILKSCSRCKMTVLFPDIVRDGKYFCSPECEALDRDPQILRKIDSENRPAVVRKRAAALLAVSLPVAIYLTWFPPQILGTRWVSTATFLLPLYFLAELVTGMDVAHASLWYQSLPEWKRSLITFGIMVLAFGGMAGGIYLYVALSPRF
jgi:hypothetical protein